MSPLLVILFGGLFAMFQQKTGQKGISVTQAYEMMQSDSNVVVLDVRTPAEYASETGHLWFQEKGQKKDALLIPIQELPKRIDELAPYRGRTIIAYCRSGNRSGIATDILSNKDFKVFNLEGGIVQWHKEQLPVIK